MKKHIYLLLLIVLLVIGCQKSPKQTNPKFQGVKNEQGLLNVLLIGSDSRGEAQARADTIMIAQYNKQEKTVKLASIMRDSYVEIPTYDKKYNKINAAYYYGGPELLRKTIQHNFGIDVSHYVTVDFAAFEKIVDTIAPEGITVNVTQTIIDDMGLHVQPGSQQLHGKELLKYARFRHDAESDFGRVQRQQEVLQALQKAFTEKVQSVDGVFQLPMMVQDLLPYIQTSMDTQMLFSLGSNVLVHPIEKVKTMRIPVANGYEPKTYEHAGAVLELHPQTNKEAIHDFFMNSTKAVNH
ncbi:LCP family protein [Bacillus cereus group sp. BfR-BA-01380]|uniref:LCP family protein n=1 Tax=Bacillus cereus group sp. BfR-BA-01380 TaxID=2920324 RepID=UPI001F574F96|nr:LCP family protein [Bacillus cereus group sp. BfR-BA-01380]